MSKNNKTFQNNNRPVQIQREQEQQSKQVNPATDKDNYVVQVVVDGKVIKEVIALNSTINIIHIGDQSVAADIR